MGFPPSPPYNPTISKVPVLDTSSGDPLASRDPNSVASIGTRIQSMKDQANADRLYDAPIKEGFADMVMNRKPWITNSQACRRIQGFTDLPSKSSSDILFTVPLDAGIVFTVGAVMVVASFLR
jgi:hypothetical protein